VAILTSDKIGFKPKILTVDNESHYILIKGSIHQVDITIINIHAPNMSTPKHIKPTLTD